MITCPINTENSVVIIEAGGEEDKGVPPVVKELWLVRGTRRTWVKAPLHRGMFFFDVGGLCVSKQIHSRSHMRSTVRSNIYTGSQGFDILVSIRRVE